MYKRQPIGWLRCSVAGSIGEEAAGGFYWNTISGLTQWEHPFVAYLAGVVERLVDARAVEEERMRNRG